MGSRYWPPAYPNVRPKGCPVYKKILIIILSSLGMVGCVSPQVINQLDNTYDGDNVTVIRNGNFFGSGIRFWVTVDGENVAGLFTKQYVNFGLAEGSHKIGIRYLGGSFLPAWEHVQVDIDVSKNESQFYLLSPGVLQCDIERIEEKEALERIRESLEIQLGSAAPCNRGVEKILCL